MGTNDKNIKYGKIIPAVLLALIIFSSCINKNTGEETIINDNKDYFIEDEQNSAEESNLNNNDFSQSMDFPRVMYVNSPEGLRIRKAPSLDSAKIGIYLYGGRVIVYKQNDVPATIDGLTEYWYQTSHGYFEGKYYDSAWVFGGYLSEDLPLDVPVIFGLWEEENNNSIIYYFSPDNNYQEGLKESEWFNIGKWELNGDKLTLVTESGPYEKLHSPEIEEAKIFILNRNNIQLKFSDGTQVNLVRSEDPYISY